MQFGLKNAPAVFQRMMNTQFASIITQGNVIIYFDNILIATEDYLEAHRDVVGQVLDHLQKLNLYLKPSKCIFETRRIEFLGVVLENGTVMMDLIKVSGVREWKVHTNGTENCAFQGFTNFYHCFILLCHSRDVHPTWVKPLLPRHWVQGFWVQVLSLKRT